MLDDGTVLFLANYVNTYSLYARTMTFPIGLLLQSIGTLPRHLKPKVGAYAFCDAAKNAASAVDL